MKLEVRLFAYLRDGRDKKVYVEVLEGITTVTDVLAELKIPQEEASLILINGLDGNLDSTFKENDFLSLFPPVGGG